MRAFKVKTNIEVSKQNGDGGTNDFMAWKNPIQGALFTAERSKEENEVHNTSESVSASDLPELVVFIQESDYKTVKDIFIHREVPTWSGLNNKDGGSGDNEEPRKTLRILSSVSNEIEQDFQNYVRKQHGLDNLMKDGGEGSNRRDTQLLDKPTEKMTPGMLQHMKEVRNYMLAPTLNSLSSSTKCQTSCT